MKISARVYNTGDSHSVVVRTNDEQRSIEIPPKKSGYGSGVNGGELLCLALATCFCNDLYREGERQSIAISAVEVEVTAEFGGEGEPARNIEYRANVQTSAPKHDVDALLRHTDAVAEIHNTLRSGCSVTLRF